MTGGGRGIGAAVAKALAQRGCRVLITYRSNVDAAADSMLALPGDGHDARQCDVTDADAVAQLLARGNVRAGARVVVVDACHGVVAGAVAERCGERGAVLLLYEGQ